MQEPIGIVASGATREAMTFYAADNIRTDYVCVKEKNGTRLVFEVLRVYVQNNRLADFDAVRFMAPGDDYIKYNVYTAETVPIACLNHEGRPYHDGFAVAAPGSKVFQAATEDLAQIYDIAAGDGKHKIGTLMRNRDVGIYLDLDAFLSRQVHLAVVGRTGSGKSWLTTHILDFLKMRRIIFSPTDEYDNLNLCQKVYKKTDIVLQLSMETAKQLLDLRPSERRLLSDYLHNKMDDHPYNSDELYADMINYFRPKPVFEQISLISDSISDVPLPQYAATLCSKIEALEFQIQKMYTGDEEELPQTVVYNLQGCRRSDEERIIYSALYPLFERRKERFRSSNGELPAKEHIVIVLEEAQNYIPSVRSSICRDLLIEIARTGRKYGIHLLLLSQRPRYIDQTVLSQCGGGVFFHLPNPEDVEYVMTSASLNSSAPFKNMIHRFDTGECIIMRAERSSRDLLCKVSDFSTIEPHMSI